MLQQVLFISVTGILVVFGFLALMYFILSSFKYFFYNDGKSVGSNGQKASMKSSQKLAKGNENLNIEGDISAEVIAVIMSSLNHFHDQNINGKEISIKKRR